MLRAPGQSPPRSRVCPTRATAYRVLNQERRESGMAPLSVVELNKFATLWDLMQETNRIINARKPAAGLFGGVA